MTTPGSHPDSGWTTNAVSMLSPRNTDAVPSSSRGRHCWSQVPAQAPPLQSPSQRGTVRQYSSAAPPRSLGLPDRNLFNAAFNAATSAGDLYRSSRRIDSSGAITDRSTDHTTTTLTPPASHSSRASRPRSMRSSGGLTVDPGAGLSPDAAAASGADTVPSPSIIATGNAIAADEDEDSSYSPIAEGDRVALRTPPWQRGSRDRHQLPRPSTAPFASQAHNFATDYEPPDPWGVGNLMGGAFGSRPSWAGRGARERSDVYDENRISPRPSLPPATGGAASSSREQQQRLLRSTGSGHALEKSNTAPPSPSPGEDGAPADAPRVFVSRLRGVASAGVVPSHPIEAPASLSGSNSSSHKGTLASGSGSAGTFALPATRAAGWIPPGATSPAGKK